VQCSTTAGGNGDTNSYPSEHFPSIALAKKGPEMSRVTSLGRVVKFHYFHFCLLSLYLFTYLLFFLWKWFNFKFLSLVIVVIDLFVFFSVLPDCTIQKLLNCDSIGKLEEEIYYRVSFGCVVRFDYCLFPQILKGITVLVNCWIRIWFNYLNCVLFFNSRNQFMANRIAAALPDRLIPNMPIAISILLFW